jgi:hypothetical protein
MFSKLWQLFLARFHLSDKAVCEQSRGRDLFTCFHDYQDSEEGVPMHFHTYTCKRCGKNFTI